jgi:hypothetical protein
MLVRFIHHIIHHQWESGRGHIQLDALALRVAERGQLAAAQQLLATADDAALAAVNIVDEVDRLNAHRARELISGERQALSATTSWRRTTAAVSKTPSPTWTSKPLFPRSATACEPP